MVRLGCDVATDQPVWFITGASRGLGAAIAEEALAAGARVAATFRDHYQVEQFMQNHPAALGLVMDLTEHCTIQTALNEAIAAFGRLDVLVNNAGAGLFGAIEEVEDDAFRSLMDINVFGPIAVIRAALPQMRKQRGGLIFQLSSISGVRAMAGLGTYAASKFALEGASEALALELAPLGIKVVIVEPGPFRTDWIAGAAEVESQKIDDYADTAHAMISRLHQLNGRQPGSPEKAARVLISVAREPEGAPLRLTLGPNAQARLAEKLTKMTQDLHQSEVIGGATDFD
jgi:NAD(P)-dependent dehydrogenase (short-subunit alcohol dehydrogenase family)